MTDLDTLRRALQAPEDTGDPVDISSIIMRGRRFRRRRILTAVAGGACAAAAVFGAVTGITHLTRSSPAPGLNPADSTRSGPTLNRPATQSPSPDATPSPSPSRVATSFLSPTSVPSPSTDNPTASPTSQVASSPSPSDQPGSYTSSASESASETPTPTPTRLRPVGSAVHHVDGPTVAEPRSVDLGP